VFGINYAPEQTGIGPYTTELTEHLAGRGWRVTVVTGVPHYPQWRVADGYRIVHRRREDLGGVTLRRVRHHVPAQQSALGRVLYEATFLAQALSVRCSPHTDRILGIVPSLSGGVAAAMVAKRHRIPYGIVFQDLMGQAAAQSGMPGGRVAAGPARAIESRVARRASRVAVVAEPFLNYFKQVGVEPDRLCMLPNWSRSIPPTSSQAADLRRALGWKDDERVALHAGNMGFKQDLENVVNAARIAAAARHPVRFVLMGDGNERRRLEILADGLPNMEFLDPYPCETFMDVLGAADILLLNERCTVSDMSLPSKITSYFLAGRPVLAAVPPGGTTARELSHSGGAFMVPAGDPVALLAGVHYLGDHPHEAQQLVAKAGQYARHDLDRVESLARAERFVESIRNDLVAR
jgi:colanic acid biosynthesis glycosyl transferase WcaI